MVKKNFLKSSLFILVIVALVAAILPISNVRAAGVRPVIKYSAHSQTFGWDKTGGVVTAANTVENAKLVGTTGECKRVEALKLNFKAVDAKLEANAHVQGKGWMGWTTVGEDDVIIGTQGESKRVESIKLSVTGLTDYSIWYRAHVQGYGWMDWVKATDSKDLSKDFAGTAGECKRIEALEIVVLGLKDSDFLEAKQKALKELNEIANPADYTVNADELAEVIKTYTGLINGVTDPEKVGEFTRFVNDARRLIKKISSDADLAKDAKVAAESKVKIIEDSFESKLKATSVRAGEKTTFLQDRAIKAAVDNAKATIRTAKTVEEAGELYETVADSILEAVGEYVAEYIENVYNNGLTVQKTKYLLAEGRYETLLEKLDALVENPGDRSTRLTNIMNILSTGNLGVNDSDATLNGDLRSLKVVKEFYLGELADIKYATIKNQINAVAGKVTTVTSASSEVEYYRQRAVDSLNALKDETVSKYSQVSDIYTNAESSILDTVKTYANKVITASKASELGSGYYKTDKDLVHLREVLNKKDVKATEITANLYTIFCGAH